MTDQPLITLNDGRDMPQIGLGVYELPDSETAELVRKAVATGYRSVDTASFYENERGVAEGLRGTDGIFLTTKLWRTDMGYDASLRAFDASLERLDRDSIDLYLIHWPGQDEDLYIQSWRALIRLREEGRAKSIGVSNFNPSHLERLIGETGVVPAVNQIELHPHFQQKALREFHAAHGIVTESWAPLGRGAVLGEPTIAAIAAKHERTAAQVVLRWHLELGLISIPKTGNPARLGENLAAIEFRLDEEDIAAISALDRADGRIGPDPASV
ncbi:oxidoreductase [Sphingomonas oleivorans]|uniref:Oxidoreductase n=1 Tax=Sphingomonas oleivorans TaxID=1735121 RepID=A0A2T5FXR0_9SPHN|nr:aldo/keto reductase [Sphingomonas oleivorans]PTQ10921.1 oxidoreductase [Sphingomonas oleivorans]